MAGPHIRRQVGAYAIELGIRFQRRSLVEGRYMQHDVLVELDAADVLRRNSLANRKYIIAGHCNYRRLIAFYHTDDGEYSGLWMIRFYRARK